MKAQLFRFTFLLSICLTLPLTTAAQVVDIRDSNLRARIGMALNKASGATITAAEMETLDRLEARNANISDLTGLESATNLTTLNLGHQYLVSGPEGNELFDVAPVAPRDGLRWSPVNNNSVSDLSPLAGLTNLETLSLDFNSISDISALSGLTNLETLSLDFNSISDIAPLVENAGLAGQDLVELHGNRLSYPSIHTHVPVLTGRGVRVMFYDRLPAILLRISGTITMSDNLIVIEVRGGEDLPFAGVPVTFTVTSGGGG